MEIVNQGFKQEFFDYEGPPSLFKLIDKDQNNHFKLKVIKKELTTHDTWVYRLEFPNAEWISGLFAGGHYVFHADIDGKHYARKYTPISAVNHKGYADFPVKIYRPCEEFPNGGAYTKWLEKNVNVGDHIICEGPIGKIRYLGPGRIRLTWHQADLKPKSNVFLCAGGSGLTPLLSIAQASVLSNDGVKMTLIFSNKTKGDIMCEEQIKELEEKGVNFKVFHTLTRHDEAKDGAWNGLTGRITVEMLKQCGLPAPADDVYVATCGPNGLVNGVRAELGQHGYVKGENFH